ncbi:transcriptional repressor [bacterium (Candidatus Blackallbacteria) CG17_big_fil_post_rev_8_21_14_2_50_48_46]|uniref:Transcriptional repressor n=1 Tax=bacterium (Candidatus Blackallbacteria) CG17_big_fil_post_rev_8_21_14_2_50_48_46 TaxID=2014261 RepID=A0A2M7FZ71_9BACT|nr:MAG: transcriptional repressor [bacterium (Candidatus Blackallbacteria) CG18_big_fil_WC_8_21_14_2_50_49_26]PIW14703.1 MAG: transcriptional repressor [bacterium (Candidatus Blackallbacteria) CG17_big_fil_post_rev_8_21_14_2_50_48_46]PIW50805.1 MAG: transcriptional repressor [bacterium (Candidatus Blackallbacteria) CG13_big_fil_rev_8_21_14_2_50_49_14]
MSAEHLTHSHSHPDASHRLEQALDLLKEARLKLTRPRKALIEVLVREHGPFTIEELAQKIHDTPCDPATIYRNMDAFEDLNLVRQCDFGDGMARYEMIGADEEHHHHIICRKCRKLELIDLCFVKELEKLVRDRGYIQVNHSLEFYGICADCQAKSGK